MTEAEAEELAVRKRRAEGTPCNDETFYIWRDKFDAEMKAEKLKAEEEAGGDSKKKGGGKEKKVVDKSGRLTGFEQFSGQTGTLDWEAMEAATENAQRDEDSEDEEEDQDDEANLEDVDEELFDVDDDDLDDLDFDDDDDDDDDDEEEPDI